MRKYPNFYESIKEARDRLNRTIVLYEEPSGPMPYKIMAITDHEKDGIFRVYLSTIGGTPDDYAKKKDAEHQIMNWSADHPGLGPWLDEWLEKNPDCGITRKHMNSPYFNYFRPFPLGMCNVGTKVYYCERQPIRPAMQQGLVKSAIWETLITAGSRQDNPTKALESLDIYSDAFKDCILGDYYSPQAVLQALLDPNIANDAHAIHREFALVRGPLDMLFLAYRTDIIGILPKSNFDYLRIGREFSHCREAVEELQLFNHIV